MPRVKTYDARDIAIDLTETFKDRPYEYEKNFPSNWWPSKLQNVGDSLAVAYSSDKWKPKDKQGKRDWESYKHLAESRNRAFVKKGLLVDYDNPDESWPVCGPTVSIRDWVMPDSFSILAFFEEINLLLYERKSGKNYLFSEDEDDGVVKVTLRHGMLGGSKLKRNGKLEPFLLIYTESQGVQIIVIGDELDILKDGIVG